MDEKQAHTHRTEIAGVPDEPSAETEHRDTARGDADARNELRLDERAEGDRNGPRTHSPTRSTEKSD